MDDFNEKFKKAIEDYATKNQYGVSKIPYHTHNGVDSPVISTSATTGLIKSGTFTTDTTITSLGGVDSAYRLVIYSRGTTNFDTGLQINGDTGANYDWFHLLGYNNAGGGNLTSYNAQIATTAIQLNNYSSNYMYMSIDFSPTSDFQRLINYQLMTKKDLNNYETMAGSAVWYTAAEISSLTITHLGGPNPVNGFYWLYQLN